MRLWTNINLLARDVLHWFSEVRQRVNIPMSLRLFVLQLAGAFSVLYGISYWSVPAALIVGGIAVIAAIENRSNARETPEEEAKVRALIDGALARGVNPLEIEGVPLTPKWLTYIQMIRRARASK